MGYEPVEHSALYGVIGAPLEYGFKTLFNMSDDEIEYAVKNYSKLYSQKGKEMFSPSMTEFMTLFVNSRKAVLSLQ